MSKTLSFEIHLAVHQDGLFHSAPGVILPNADWTKFTLIYMAADDEEERVVEFASLPEAKLYAESIFALESN